MTLMSRIIIIIIIIMKIPFKLIFFPRMVITFNLNALRIAISDDIFSCRQVPLLYIILFSWFPSNN